jgi:hypothetical protein
MMKYMTEKMTGICWEMLLSVLCAVTRHGNSEHSNAQQLQQIIPLPHLTSNIASK